MPIKIRAPSAVSLVPSGFQVLIQQRLRELGESPFQAVEFIVAEPGDAAADLEAASGCCITSDLFGDADFGHPDFAPSFEWLEHRRDAQCFEMVFILTDDGFSTVILVPDDPGIDPELRAFCLAFAD